MTPEHLKHNPYSWLNSLLNGGEPRHATCPDDSISMVHTEDLVELILTASEHEVFEGRFFGVYESLHWEDIYRECETQIPDMVKPIYPTTRTAKPTEFDFSRETVWVLPSRLSDHARPNNRQSETIQSKDSQ